MMLFILIYVLVEFSPVMVEKHSHQEGGVLPCKESPIRCKSLVPRLRLVCKKSQVRGDLVKLGIEARERES